MKGCLRDKNREYCFNGSFVAIMRFHDRGAKSQRLRFDTVSAAKHNNKDVFTKPVWMYTERCLYQNGVSLQSSKKSWKQSYTKKDKISVLNFSLAGYSYFAINAALFIKENDFPFQVSFWLVVGLQMSPMHHWWPLVQSQFYCLQSKQTAISDTTSYQGLHKRNKWNTKRK